MIVIIVSQGGVLHYGEHHRGLVSGLVPGGGGQARAEQADEPGGEGLHHGAEEL